MKLAPPVTPMVEGEAIVLRITPCRIQPDSDRQIPTSPPTSTRGKRRFQIRRRAVLSSSTKSALATSETENFTLPMPVQIKIESTDSSPNRAMMPSGPFFSSPRGKRRFCSSFPQERLHRRLRLGKLCLVGMSERQLLLFKALGRKMSLFALRNPQPRGGPAQVDAAPAKIMP